MRKLPKKDLYRVYSDIDGTIHSYGTTLENAKKQITLLNMIDAEVPTLKKGKGLLDELKKRETGKSSNLEIYSNWRTLKSRYENIQSKAALYYKQIIPSLILQIENYMKNMNNITEEDEPKITRLIRRLEDKLTDAENQIKNNPIIQKEGSGVENKKLTYIKNLFYQAYRDFNDIAIAERVNKDFTGTPAGQLWSELYFKLDVDRTPEKLKNDDQRISWYNSKLQDILKIMPFLERDLNYDAIDYVEGLGIKRKISVIENKISTKSIGMNKWVQYVKDYAAKKGIKYNEALKDPDCKAGYKKVEGGKGLVTDVKKAVKSASKKMGLGIVDEASAKGFADQVLIAKTYNETQLGAQTENEVINKKKSLYGKKYITL